MVVRSYYLRGASKSQLYIASDIRRDQDIMELMQASRIIVIILPDKSDT